MHLCKRVCVFTIFIVSSLNKVMASVARLHSNWLPKQYRHIGNCPIVGESTDFLMYTRWHIKMSVCGWRATLDRLFFSFVLRVCVITCWSELLFSLRFSVSICREESFALQLMGSIHSNLVFFRNQENK